MTIRYKVKITFVPESFDGMFSFILIFFIYINLYIIKLRVKKISVTSSR